MKNDTLFYEKRHVVLWRTIRRFMKNDTLFYEERYVVWGMLGEQEKPKKKGREKVATDESLNALISYNLSDCCKDFICAFGLAQRVKFIPLF